MPNYYEILGIPPASSLEEIKQAFRSLSKAFHPDVSKHPHAEARFKEVNQAYEVLRDPNKRAEYDRKLAQENIKPGPKAALVPDPVIGIRPQVLEFGSIKEGDSKQLSFIITNSGGPLINDPSLEWKKGYLWAKLDFVADPTNLFPIRGTVTVTTTNLVSGKYSDELIFEADGVRFSILITFSSWKPYVAPQPPVTQTTSPASSYQAPVSRTPTKTKMHSSKSSRRFSIGRGFLWFGIIVVCIMTLVVVSAVNLNPPSVEPNYSSSVSLVPEFTPDVSSQPILLTKLIQSPSGIGSISNWDIAWSSASDRLIYHSSFGSLRMVSVNGTNDHNFYISPPNEYSEGYGTSVGYVAWSPNDDWVVLVQCNRSPGDCSLILVSSDGARAQEIARPVSMQLPCWTNFEGQSAVAYMRGASVSIYGEKPSMVINPQNSSRVILRNALTEEEYRSCFPQFIDRRELTLSYPDARWGGVLSPDGKKIAYAITRYTGGHADHEAFVVPAS